jgi:hypothetical protein
MPCPYRSPRRVHGAIVHRLGPRIPPPPANLDQGRRQKASCAPPTPRYGWDQRELDARPADVCGRSVVRGALTGLLPLGAEFEGGTDAGGQPARVQRGAFALTVLVIQKISTAAMMTSAIPIAASMDPPAALAGTSSGCADHRPAAGRNQCRRGRSWSRGTSEVSSVATSIGRAPIPSSSRKTSSRSSWQSSTITRGRPSASESSPRSAAVSDS